MSFLFHCLFQYFVFKPPGAVSVTTTVCLSRNHFCPSTSASASSAVHRRLTQCHTSFLQFSLFSIVISSCFSFLFLFSISWQASFIRNQLRTSALVTNTNAGQTHCRHPNISSISIKQWMPDSGCCDSDIINKCPE